MKSRYRVGIKVYDSAKWEKLRRLYMDSKHYICERCGRPATICHHREPLTEGNVDNPLVAYNPDNLECLCLDCHNAEHNNHFQREGAVFNSRGDVIGIRQSAELAEFRDARQAIGNGFLIPPAFVSLSFFWRARRFFPTETPFGNLMRKAVDFSMAKDKFKSILGNLNGDNKVLAESLTDEIIFLRGILDKLKIEIKNNGVTDVTLIKSYNLTVQRYGSLVKQLEFIIRQGVGKIQQGENALQKWLETVK